MPFMRTHPRTTDTTDLSARMRFPGRPSGTRAVVNLSEGGMLIDGAEFKIGELAGFELSGPDFRSSGLAEVAHRTHGRTGLKFVRWEGPDGEQVRGLIAERVHRQQLDPRTHTSPGAYLG
jgi:hypothetical protein